MSTNIEKILIILLLAWAVVSSTIAANYYLKYNSCVKDLEAFDRKTISVNILIDYGNGSKTWFNNTIVSRNSTLFSVLLSISKVNYTSGAYGIFINSINGVSNKVTGKNCGYYWMWYYYDKESKKWVMGPVGVDKWKLSEGDILKVVYQQVKW